MDAIGSSKGSVVNRDNNLCYLETTRTTSSNMTTPSLITTPFFTPRTFETMSAHKYTFETRVEKINGWTANMRVPTTSGMSLPLRFDPDPTHSRQY
jgi:hypothetical protein